MTRGGGSRARASPAVDVIDPQAWLHGIVKLQI
jgi:hypothetical protein